MQYEIDLPWPPSVNHYKKVGRIVKTKTGKIYQQRKNTLETEKFYFDTYILNKCSMPSGWLKFACSETISFEVYIDMHPPLRTSHRRWDLDNHLKVTLDAIVRAKIIHDDSQIYRLFVQKMDNIENGKVRIKIRPLGEIE